MVILLRIGRQDNDLLVFALRNKAEVLVQVPQVLRDVSFDLVKYYLKSQTATVEKELVQILKTALAGSFESRHAIAELL